MSSKSFGYAEFLASNSESKVTGFDYLNIICKSQDLPSDFFHWIALLFSPEFFVFEGRIYLQELFDAEKYTQLIQDGHTASAAQFWVNLLEITGIFDVLSTNQALELAGTISKLWNFKLNAEFGDDVEMARVIHDTDANEVFIVIGSSN